MLLVVASSVNHHSPAPAMGKGDFSLWVKQPHFSPATKPMMP